VLPVEGLRGADVGRSKVVETLMPAAARPLEQRPLAPGAPKPLLPHILSCRHLHPVG